MPSFGSRSLPRLAGIELLNRFARHSMAPPHQTPDRWPVNLLELQRAASIRSAIRLRSCSRAAARASHAPRQWPLNGAVDTSLRLLAAAVECELHNARDYGHTRVVPHAAHG